MGEYMNFTKILMVTLMSISIANAKTSFSKYSDMCEKVDTQECLNNMTEVKMLQKILIAEGNLNSDFKVDGKWGKKTKVAVEEFQKNYYIFPAKGYVGKETKKVLNQVAGILNITLVTAAKRKTNKNKMLTKEKKLKKVTLLKNSKTTFTGCYADFVKKTNLKKSFKVFKDKSLLSKANGKNTKLKVDISEQRVRLYVNGKVALCSPCTTGAKKKFEPNTKIYRDKRTPKGTFKITEKISDKRSTIFGKYYRNGKVVYKGDRRKYRGPKAKYKGASLRNWMRLTSSGIGLHASKYVKRHPGTNGCIRLPFKVAKTIFSKVRTGTKVSIVN